MSDKLRLLVVDDTATYRLILANVINTIPDVILSGTANNGRVALEKLAEMPVDLVLLDIEMPEMDGLEALRAIKERYPKTGVVMISGMNRHSADITIKALEAGALDFISKPDAGDAQSNKDILTKKLTPIIRLMTAKRQRETAQHVLQQPSAKPLSAVQALSRLAATPIKREAPAQPVVTAPSAGKPAKIDVIAIGVSTGGPNALMTLIPRLPGDLGVPILLVQHMPAVFTASLASSLNAKSQLLVKEGEAGEIVRPNTVYIAPGGRHMTVRSDREPGSSFSHVQIGLNDNPPENSCRPAVDVLFRSVSATYGRNVLAVVMTGMGTDGTRGVQVLKQSGCYCLTQSESTCVVYGMPRSIDNLGLSDERVDLSEMAGRITAMVKKPL